MNKKRDLLKEKQETYSARLLQQQKRSTAPTRPKTDSTHCSSNRKDQRIQQIEQDQRLTQLDFSNCSTGKDPQKTDSTRQDLAPLLQQQKRSTAPTNRTRPNTDSTRLLQLLYWKRSTKDRDKHNYSKVRVGKENKHPLEIELF
jgi:hypothetical protein